MSLRATEGSAAISSLETVRLLYRPPQIKVLFVGESPPAGGTFFFCANSTLSRYTQRAFEIAFDQCFASGAEFLQFFKSHDYYLDDLSIEPVNRIKASSERSAVLRASIPDFAERLHDYRPEAIVVVKLSIVSFVMQAVESSGIGISDERVFAVGHPAHGHHKQYVERLVHVLRSNLFLV